MRQRAPHLFREVHILARAYHWSERDLLGLSLPRRRRYLMLLEEDRDASLLPQFSA
jgi:hypothetical protein